jgi:hypothetical protein
VYGIPFKPVGSIPEFCEMIYLIRVIDLITHLRKMKFVATVN